MSEQPREGSAVRHDTGASAPDNPTDITKPSWIYVLRTTVRQFIDDECGDLAAGLTYRTIFSIFPGIVALVSILSLMGQSGSTVSTVLDEAQGIIPADTWESVRPAFESILTAPAPGLGLIFGLVVALWSASRYVRGFSRAMNKIYSVPEGRGPIKLNAQMYLFTAFILILGALALLTFVLSGPIAQAVGGAIGMSGTALAIWNVAKWFLLGFIVILVIALLYYFTPNVKQPGFRWISIGAVVAIVVSVLATLGFFFYVSNFGSYNATYGTLAGVIILLLWVYIINAILLFGAELDSEIERVRELQSGIPAEVDLQLPVRDSKATVKKARKDAEAVARARNLRLSAGESNGRPESRH